MPNMSMKKLLEKRFKVYLLDEYNSSSLGWKMKTKNENKKVTEKYEKNGKLCTTIKKLHSVNKKNDYKESDDEIDKMIYRSRYSDGDMFIDNNKFFMSDMLVFNKNHTIKKLEYVPYYLSYCQYTYLQKDDICMLDGWIIQWFSYYCHTIPYYIQYDKDNRGKKYRLFDDIFERIVLRAIISLMIETPIEHLNVNNYAMLKEYNRICYE